MALWIIFLATRSSPMPTFARARTCNSTWQEINEIKRISELQRARTCNSTWQEVNIINRIPKLQRAGTCNSTWQGRRDVEKLTFVFTASREFGFATCKRQHARYGWSMQVFSLYQSSTQVQTCFFWAPSMISFSTMLASLVYSSTMGVRLSLWRYANGRSSGISEVYLQGTQHGKITCVCN